MVLVEGLLPQSIVAVPQHLVLFLKFVGEGMVLRAHHFHLSLQFLDHNIFLCHFLLVLFPCSLDFFLHMFPIFEYNLKGLLQFAILFPFALVLFFYRPALLLELFVLFFKIVAVLYFVLEFLVCFCEFELDEVDFFLALLQVRLDAALGVGDLVVEGEERVVDRVVVVFHPYLNFG
jgi:hypothetical protein